MKELHISLTKPRFYGSFLLEVSIPQLQITHKRKSQMNFQAYSFSVLVFMSAFSLYCFLQEQFKKSSLTSPKIEVQKEVSSFEEFQNFVEQASPANALLFFYEDEMGYYAQGNGVSVEYEPVKSRWRYVADGRETDSLNWYLEALRA